MGIYNANFIGRVESLVPQKIKQKILVSILCYLLGFAVAACTMVPSSEPTVSAPELEVPSNAECDGKSFVNTLETPAEPYASLVPPKLTARVHEKHELNSDTVGWLQVPNTTIDDVVLWYPGDENDYYYRRNFEKRQSFSGVYYADFRCKFDGTSAGLMPNTVIYGHSMSDNPAHESGLFSPLKYYKNEDFSRENPYIYFSISEEDLLWEVFAVFYATTKLQYNTPVAPDFLRIIGECRARSIYNYDVGVTEKDKLLTLSTCTYSKPDGTTISYPNDYRYVVMAKLVTDKSSLKNEAKITENPNIKAP